MAFLYERGDEIITKNIEKNTTYLGIGISNIIKMFNPELIIIHGVVVKFGNKYLNKVKEAVSNTTFPKVKSSYNIKFSELGEEIGLIGTTSFVVNSILDLDNSKIEEEYMIKN